MMINECSSNGMEGLWRGAWRSTSWSEIEVWANMSGRHKSHKRRLEELAGKCSPKEGLTSVELD